MKTAIKSLSLVIVLVALTFTSCTKEGETGPMGPAGINGTDGTDGEDGNDGNANVMASDWLEPTESSYSVNNPRYKALPQVYWRTGLFLCTMIMTRMYISSPTIYSLLMAPY